MIKWFNKQNKNREKNYSWASPIECRAAVVWLLQQAFKISRATQTQCCSGLW